MSKIGSLIRNLFRKRRVERDLDDEVRSYVEMLADEKLDRGMGAADALRAARVEFGGVDVVKENVREVRMGATIEWVWRDVRYAARVLAKSPAFTAVAVLTIGLGIGANTAVFSVFNTVLLRPLPYPGEKQIVAVYEKRMRENGARSALSASDFLDWRSMTRTLASVALFDTTRLNVTQGGDTELVPGARVTAGFFEALGVPPQLGRTFQVAEEDSGRQQVAILTYGAWQRRFGGDPEILGKNLRINGEPFQVVGVLPERFRYPFAAACELFIPLRFTQDQLRFRGIHAFGGIARLRDGVTVGQASREMEVMSKQIEKQHPDTNAGHVADVVPLHEEQARGLKPALVVLLGAVALVILIACANVANLLLARASVRARETAVRAALGGSRARLVMQSLIESAVLALAGAAAGVALAWWALTILRSVFFRRLDFFSTVGLDQIALDWRVLAFTLACALLSTLLFGVSPALACARTNLNDALRTGGRGMAGGERHRVRSVLVVVQVALSLTLLTGAGLLGKSFLNLMNVNPGFRPQHVVTASISLPGSQYRTTEQAAAFYDALVERTGALPGVRMAGVTDTLPLSGDDNRAGVRVEGREPRPNEPTRLNPRLVSPAYLQTMGVRLVEGRMFTAADAEGKRPVAIVSEAAARKYWSDSNPVGRRFQFAMDNAPWIEVIGVAGSVHNRALDLDSTADVYLPYRENPFGLPPRRVTLTLESDLDAAALASGIRAAVVSLDRAAAVSGIRSMESWVADSSAPQWFNVVLLASFAGMAMVLAAAGLYGILSYLVSRRTAEIGVRMALGAGKLEVLRMVMARGLGLTAAGILLGTLGSLAATQLLSKLLFGVTPRDPAVFVLIPPFLAAVALVASYIPAHRATKVDPLAALRME